MKPILSDTLAPPRMPTSGRWRVGQQLVEDLQFLGDQQADDARLALHRRGHGDHRGVLAVAGAEGVVDVDVAEGGELRRRSSGSLFCSPGWKRRFSSSSTSPGFSACAAAVDRRADDLVAPS